MNRSLLFLCFYFFFFVYCFLEVSVSVISIYLVQIMGSSEPISDEFGEEFQFVGNWDDISVLACPVVAAVRWNRWSVSNPGGGCRFARRLRTGGDWRRLLAAFMLSVLLIWWWGRGGMQRSHIFHIRIFGNIDCTFRFPVPFQHCDSSIGLPFAIKTLMIPWLFHGRYPLFTDWLVVTIGVIVIISYRQ